jgi:hypothetical protein
MKTNFQEYASATEQKIIKRLVNDALAAGYLISVHDGEEVTVKRSSDKAAILAAMATTEADNLIFHNEADRIGSVHLIYGNETDIISEMTWKIGCQDKLETLVSGASQLAEELTA